MRYDTLAILVQLLNQLAADLNLEHFLHYYWRNHPQIIPRPKPVTKNLLFIILKLKGSLFLYF